MKHREPNRTASGQLACGYGVLWIHHFGPPIGDGRGCRYCDRVGLPVGQLRLPF